MAYSDQEMRNFTQIAYADFKAPMDTLKVLYPDRKSFTIAELLDAAKADNSGADYSCLKCLTEEQRQTWKISAIMDHNEKTGFYACVIETSPGEAAVGFRGSESAKDISNLTNDWIKADLGLLNSTQTSQHAEVEEFLRQEFDTLNKYDNLTMTGHSLGGNLAEYATIVSEEYGLDDNIERCVSFDGPGFSDEFISKNSNRINHMKDKMTHYRWSLVGGMLFDLPGVTYITCEVSNDANKIDNKKYNMFTRHDTKYLVFDENGNIKKGSRDGLSWLVYGFSRKLELVFSGGSFINFFMMPYILFSTGLTDVNEFFNSAFGTVKNIYKSISDVVKKYLNRSQVYFRVNTAYLRSDADKISASISNVRELVSQMFESIQSLTGMWNGPANAAFTAKFAKEQDDINAYLERIQGYVYSIESDSRAYESCENKALDIIHSMNF